tara:strand:+ start:436 stop:1164 length:729 start_codon:yes stop_codon:yes gene_type:complete
MPKSKVRDLPSPKENGPATNASVWATFSKIDSTDKLQTAYSADPDGFKPVYVNWIDTLATARDTFPQIVWEFLTYEDGAQAYFFPDQSAEVKVAIRIEEAYHETTLAVTTNNGKIIKSPNSNDINNAKRRALCKCLGEMGLFWQLWSSVEFSAFVANSTFVDDLKEPETETKNDTRSPEVFWKQQEELVKKNLPSDAEAWQKLKQKILEMHKQVGIDEEKEVVLDNLKKIHTLVLERKNNGS